MQWREMARKLRCSHSCRKRKLTCLHLTLSDSELTALLWKIIEGLADIGVYLTSTDHLSDRELYTVLWQDTLIQEHPIVPDEFQMMTHIDLLGGWSNEDMRTYLKYYADDQERARFASET